MVLYFTSDMDISHDWDLTPSASFKSTTTGWNPGPPIGTGCLSLHESFPEGKFAAFDKYSLLYMCIKPAICYIRLVDRWVWQNNGSLWALYIVILHLWWCKAWGISVMYMSAVALVNVTENMKSRTQPREVFAKGLASRVITSLGSVKNEMGRTMGQTKSIC